MLRLVLEWFLPVFKGMGFGVLVMMLHEMGHLMAAFVLGLRVRGVGINWKGLYMVRETGPLGSNLLVSLAGPVANLLLALLWYRAALFSLANLCFGLVNLLPIQGSDGDRILGSIEARLRSRQTSA
ncbi:MAG: M50 family metallopeptidase [Terracidiphilus sp.]